MSKNVLITGSSHGIGAAAAVEFARQGYNVGITYYYMGDFSHAAEYLEKALVICEKVLPPTHPDIASTRRSLASVRSRMK